MDNNANETKKKKSGNLSLILAVVFFLLCIFCFKDHRFLAGFIAFLQTGLFGTAWCMKKNIIKDTNPAIPVLMCVAGLIMIIPLIMVVDKKPLPRYAWPESGLALRLPKPKSDKGEIIYDSNETFSIKVAATTKDQYENYIQECKKSGYTVEPDTSSGYMAYDDEGYELDVSYWDSLKEMSVHLEAPVEYGKLNWPKSEMAKLIPEPGSQTGMVDVDSSDRFVVHVSKTTRDDFNKYIDACSDRGFNVGYDRKETIYTAEDSEGYRLSIEYEGNEVMLVDLEKPEKMPEEAEVKTETEDAEETEEETEETKEAEQEISSEETDTEEASESAEKKENIKEKLEDTLIREDIKEAIDSYEAFVDEYCEFMKSYDSSDLTMLTKYTRLMAKEIEMAKEFEDIEDKDLTDAEALYYSEVSLRCSEKMLKAASQMK